MATRCEDFESFRKFVLSVSNSAVPARELQSLTVTNGLRSMRACPVEQFQQCRPPDGTFGVPMRGTGAHFQDRAARLAKFKVPDALIVRDTLPRNPSGKVLKHVLRRELAKQ